MSTALVYPWYEITFGDEIEQGDIIEECPLFLPPKDLDPRIFLRPDARNLPKVQGPIFDWEQRNAIVMSQTCDMKKGREKVDQIALCALWERSQLPEKWRPACTMEDIRKGRMAGLHLLAECSLPDFRHELQVVDFKRVHTLPLSFLRGFVGSKKRLRLLPPYREHLSQALGGFFMRVGLPVDIPPITK